MIGEFDLLFNASNEIRNQRLQPFHEIRQTNHLYTIDSIVVCGTFSLQDLSSTNQRVSPFNISEAHRNPYFTLEQTMNLFKQYAEDGRKTIDDQIVHDIFLRSNGHPGMICFCGHSIYEKPRSKVINSTNHLNYDTWQNFSADNQNERMLSYHTFRRIVDSLLSESVTGAVNLLRTHFFGYLDDVPISNLEKQRLADFLTAEGALIKVDGNNYRMASAFNDSFAKRHIIPSKYPHSPSESPPKERVRIIGYSEDYEGCSSIFR
ncbi:hypothetical protein BX616_011155 [Lobosporangium transversale]|nr:hypothetical protein BX616_011155 [Lobosporangium transversale]